MELHDGSREYVNPEASLVDGKGHPEDEMFFRELFVSPGNVPNRRSVCEPPVLGGQSGQLGGHPPVSNPDSYRENIEIDKVAPVQQNRTNKLTMLPFEGQRGTWRSRRHEKAKNSRLSQLGSQIGKVYTQLRVIVNGDIFGTHPAVKEIYNKGRSVKLKESVWDVTLFMFYRPLGRSTNWSVLCPIVFTVLLQVSFLHVVVRCIVHSEDTPTSMQHGFAVWRSDADESVVNAVCARNFSLTSSYKQANTFGTYKTYSETLLLEGHGWGGCVFCECVLASRMRSRFLFEVACFCVDEPGRALEIAL